MERSFNYIVFVVLWLLSGLVKWFVSRGVFKECVQGGVLSEWIFSELAVLISQVNQSNNGVI